MVEYFCHHLDTDIFILFMYTACCLMMIPVYIKFSMPMSKTKDYVQTQIHGEMYE